MSRTAKETTLLKFLPVGALLLLVAAPAPALADVKDDYMAACMKASGDNTELCTCKTTEAQKLVDEEMMSYIVIAMADPARFNEMVGNGEVPEAVITKWPFYVRDSNKVCAAPAE